MFGMLALTIASLGLMPSGAPRGARRGGIYREIVLGVRYAAAQPRLRLLLVSLMLISIFGQPYQVLLPGLLENTLGEPAERIGVLQGVAGIGSFVVGLAVAGFVGSAWSGRVMYSMALLFGAGVALLALTPNVAVAFPFMFMIGAGISAFQAVNTAEVLVQSEPAYHGRLTALTFLSVRCFDAGGAVVRQYRGCERGADRAAGDGVGGSGDRGAVGSALRSDSGAGGASGAGSAGGAAADRGGDAGAEDARPAVGEGSDVAVQPGDQAVVVLLAQLGVAGDYEGVGAVGEADEFDALAAVAQGDEVLFALGDWAAVVGFAVHQEHGSCYVRGVSDWESDCGTSRSFPRGARPTRKYPRRRRCRMCRTSIRG